MVRYKRYKRRRGASTRTIKMKFQSFMDINTSANSMQIITVSAGGANVMRRLSPQFGAYKYYKLGGVSVKLVPASTLPVDPTGLSYEVGQNNSVDPRDQLTPGMMRITNGEDIFEDISGLIDTEQHEIYNNMLLDPRWFKWMLQSGVKRYATPRYWILGQLHQDKFPGTSINLPAFAFDGDTAITGTEQVHDSWKNGVGEVRSYGAGSSPRGLFQVGHTGKLGWMPTDGLQPVPTKAGALSNIKDIPLLASPPEIEVMKIILPKAYKTQYYYRMFITETVYFKEPIVNFGIGQFEYRPLDIFHVPGTPSPKLPSLNNIGQGDTPFPSDKDTGGNYGDD